MKSRRRRGRADADIGVCSCTIYAVDAAENERVTQRNLGPRTDGGGVDQISGRYICEAADDRITVAARVRTARRRAEKGIVIA